MNRLATLSCMVCFCGLMSACASTVATGSAQAESRSAACDAACKQITPASATPGQFACDECVCDRVATGPAVCTVREARK